MISELVFVVLLVVLAVWYWDSKWTPDGTYVNKDATSVIKLVVKSTGKRVRVELTEGEIAYSFEGDIVTSRPSLFAKRIVINSDQASLKHTITLDFQDIIKYEHWMHGGGQGSNRIFGSLVKQI